MPKKYNKCEKGSVCSGDIFKKIKDDVPNLFEKAYELPEKLEVMFENISNLDEFNDEVKSLRKEINTQKNSMNYLLITSAVIIISVISISLTL